MLGVPLGVSARPTKGRCARSRTYAPLRIRPGEPSREIRGRPLTSTALAQASHSQAGGSSINVHAQPRLRGYIWCTRRFLSSRLLFWARVDDPESSLRPKRNCGGRMTRGLFATVSALISKAHLSTQFPPASISAHRIEDRIEVVFRQPRISRLPR